MNKNELIASIAAATGLTKTDSTKALDAFINSVAKALKEGKEVRLVGFALSASANAPLRPAATPVPAKRLKFLPARLPNSNRVRLCRIL